MTAFFLMIYAITSVFFVVLMCSKPAGKSTAGRLIRNSTRGLAAERRFLEHAKHTMAALFSGQGRKAAIVLVAVAMMSLMLRAQTEQPATATSDNATLASQSSVLPTDAGSSPATDSKTVPAADPAAAVEPAADSNTLHGNFFSRFGQAYLQDWRGSDSSGPEPKYRGFPAPVSNPPFPFTVWPYGGSVTIGYPWTQSAPLMQAIWSGGNGEAWKRSGVQIYGWVNGGFNVSTSSNGRYANAPAAYFVVPNSVQPDQQVLYIERQPDTVQTDHFDWGFRVASLYGIDYRFTTAKGWFSHQLLHTNPDGTIGYPYGYDMVMAYVDLYYPHVAQGLNVRIGRYISLPDIEAQLAPNNYTYSHSLLYSYDAYTQTGINLTFKINDHWLYQIGLSAGNDVAPWVHEPNAKPTLNTCVGYTWRKGEDNIYTCMNSLNSGKYAYNNLQAAYATWYHKFNDSWHMATESWYMYQKDVPNVNNPSAASMLQINANGAVCNSVQQLTCFAPEWAILNYAEKGFSKRNYISIRNEYFDDIRGQRTGFRTRYTENGLTWGHWIGTTMLFRPELRFEHAYDAPAYSTGTKKSQFVFAGDLVYFF